MELDLTDLDYETLERALDRWGKPDQTRAAMEELAETITAISHEDRGREPMQKVIDEFADAAVCVLQVIHSEVVPRTPLGRHAGMNMLEIAINRAFKKLEMKLAKDDQNYVEGR